MPAQWPTFVTNVSSKLESRSAASRDEFAEYLANEYFTAVGQSQTPFGNIHIAGQKPILESGFKEAFKEIYENETVPFEDKFNMDSYADLFEPLPNIDYDFDPLCEIEAWSAKNSDTLSTFTFYSLFESTCPVYKELDPYGGIDFNQLVENNTQEADNQIANAEDGILYATLSIVGFTPNINYKFTYTINGVKQPPKIAGKDGVLQLRVNSQPGTYTYTFNEVLDENGVIVKEINKSATVEINSSGVAVNTTVIKDPNANKEPRPLIPELTDEEIIESLALRVIFQSDGSEEFTKWVNRLKIGYNDELGQQVRNRVYQIVGNSIQNITVIPTATELGIEITVSQYIFQNEHVDDPDRIPEWLTPLDYICKFTYVKSVDAIEDNNDLTEIGLEIARTERKEELYQAEKKDWLQRLRDWANSQKGETEESEGDGYNIMAGAIIDYWKSTATTPFQPTPPVPPCNIPAPTGGIYTPIGYGSQSTLANDLRRAWNTGKGFSKVPLTPVASKAVATAVSVACAKHLLTLKFLYLGGISTPVGPVPMVGFVPVII